MTYAAPQAQRLATVAAEPAAEAVAPVAYIGLVTRALAFAVDAAIIQLVSILVAAVFALVLSVISVPHDVAVALVAIGGVAYLLWSVGYFVVLWSATGQTPGARMFRFAICTTDLGELSLKRAAWRFAGLLLAALPLFAGFLLILVDDRRRGLHDRLAGTVAVERPGRPVAAGRRTRGVSAGAP
jgi:uncharacterized RDD family membrane protein YckC